MEDFQMFFWFTLFYLRKLGNMHFPPLANAFWQAGILFLKK
ncbi:hypothetical protein CHCC14821_0997 [Bacillus paralicheniformis]|nr:hypothetical protein CHCC14821_0997 [Bacillus paralicheniformis]